MKHKIFYSLMLIILVCITNNVSAQFVPFQSGQFKRLAADTLYDFTGCDTPTVTPNSYRRVVRYYDSCNHLNWHWQPELQAWAVSGGSAGASGDSTLYPLIGFRTAQGDVTGQLDGHNLFTTDGSVYYIIDTTQQFKVLSNAVELLQISPIEKNAFIRAYNADSGFTSQYLATAYDDFPGFATATNDQTGSHVSVEGSLRHGFTHFAAKDATGDTLTQTDMFLYAKQNGAFKASGFEILSQRGDPYIHIIGNTEAETITFDANNIFPRNGLPGIGKVPTGTDALGNFTWQTPGTDIRDTAKLVQGYGIYINNADSTYQPNKPDVLIAVDTSKIATKTDITIITNSDTAIFIVDSISNAPPAGAVDGNDYLVGTSPTGLFTGHANDIAELVGGVYTFTDPVSQQQLIVDNSVTYATYQFNGVNWVQTSILWRVGLNRAIGQNAALGRFDKAPVTIRAWNRQVIRFDTTRDVKFYKFVGTRPGNYAFFDSATGNIDTGFFRPLIEGPGISIDPGPVGDTISSTSSGGTSLSAPSGYTLHGTGTGVYQDTIIYKDTARGWVGINRTTPLSLLDVYVLNYPGTISVTNGSTTVTGTNTRFLDQFKYGDSIYINNAETALISSVSSNTSLTLTAVYAGTTAGAAPYTNPQTERGVFRLAGNGRVYQYGAPFMYNGAGAYSNTGFGYNTLKGLTTGNLNTAFGARSLLVNTTGVGNAAFGINALSANTTGAYNVSIAPDALLNNTTGNYNVAIGQEVLYANTTGEINISIGAFSMHDNAAGTHNVAIGVHALRGNNNGFGNFAGGYDALRNAYDQSSNTAIGYSALKGTNGSGNTAMGYDAVRYTNVTEVTSIGVGSLANGGSYSTALGYQAGVDATGTGNIFIGHKSGLTPPGNFLLGNNNLIIGRGASLNYNESAAANIFNTIWIDANNGTDSTASTTSRVGINNTTPAASAVLDLTSTTTGFLPPRMTATQASAISSPAEGLLVYVTDTNGTFTAKGWWGYDGAAWQKLNN